MRKPDYRINNIAPIKQNNTITYKGLHDNSLKDKYLWFDEKEDLEYICKALNFYETYYPLLKALKTNLEDVSMLMDEIK